MSKLKSRPTLPKVRPPTGEGYLQIKELTKNLNISTVCQEAKCPNIGECWESKTATFMLLGKICTRGCRFCAVTTGKPSGILDPSEPDNVAKAAFDMGLKFVVLTSVDRDDLPDSGANHFAQTVKSIKKLSPKPIVEILAPDFEAKSTLIKIVMDSSPEVYGHNLETVERLTPAVRDRRSTYKTSLNALEVVKKIDPLQLTKSSIMLGLGESKEEVVKAMRDLRNVGCDIITFGQYLSPSPKHHPVVKYVHKELFDELKLLAKEMEFLYCASGPLVRSSYKAGEIFMKDYIGKNSEN